MRPSKQKKEKPARANSSGKRMKTPRGTARKLRRAEQFGSRT